jgi:hypothetical protein
MHGAARRPARLPFLPLPRQPHCAAEPLQRPTCKAPSGPRRLPQAAGPPRGPAGRRGTCAGLPAGQRRLATGTARGRGRRRRASAQPAPAALPQLRPGGLPAGAQTRQRSRACAFPCPGRSSWLGAAPALRPLRRQLHRAGIAPTPCPPSPAHPAPQLSPQRYGCELLDPTDRAAVARVEALLQPPAPAAAAAGPGASAGGAAAASASGRRESLAALRKGLKEALRAERLTPSVRSKAGAVQVGTAQVAVVGRRWAEAGWRGTGRGGARAGEEGAAQRCLLSCTAPPCV